METAYNKYFAQDLSFIDNALRSIQLDEYETLVNDCVETIKSGHKIIASGLGKNVPICDKFVGTMLSLGLDAGFLHTNSAVHGDMGMVHAGDLVIILSKSGSTTESVYLADLLSKRAGVKLWLLTFKEESKLSSVIQKKLVIKLEHEGDLWNIIPNNSTTLNLLVLQNVAIELSKRLNLNLEENFKPNHPGGAIGDTLRNGK
ncbi:MAG: SIS domain-containing protein [Treponema sp.]|nr:SIS domain-containing protein [Treponema sp.]